MIPRCSKKVFLSSLNLNWSGNNFSANRNLPGFPTQDGAEEPEPASTKRRFDRLQLNSIRRPEACDIDI